MMEETTTSSEEVLQDAAMVQPEEQTITATPEATPTLEIGSLGEAMQAFNAAKSKTSEANLSEGNADTGDKDKLEGSGSTTPRGDDGSNVISTRTTESLDNSGTVSQSTGGQASDVSGGYGGYASDDEIYDVDAGISEVRQQLTNIAVDAVRKDFAAKKITKINVNDLMKVDERSGTKEFINPDTNRPFSSSNPRSEAQSFVRDYNADLDAQFTQQCQAIMPNIEKSYAPILEFHSFIPTWQKMDPFRQEMFEELVAGHELKDKQGNIVAYNCNLNDISDQMEKQIGWLLAQQKNLAPKAAAAADPIRQPAVAAKAQTATASDDKEYDLNNMADALKFYNKQKSKKK